MQGEIIWHSKEIGIWDYNIYQNNIIFNLQNISGIANDTYIYNKITKQNWFHRKIILSNIPNRNYYRNNILYSFDNNKAVLFDLSNGSIYAEIPFESRGVPTLITSTSFIEKKKSYIYIYSVFDFSFIKEFNLNVLFPTQENVRISQIKEYQGSLIVVTSVATLRLSAEDGSVIWINEGYARTIEIVGNTGYVCTSICLLKINLDTGEESGYGWEKNRLPDFTYEGQEHWPVGHEVVYHDGLLWYSVYDSGESFLIAINPDNGNYEWIHRVDTYEKTDAPQFYEDKMFLWDTGNVLHIYEKEK